MAGKAGVSGTGPALTYGGPVGGTGPGLPGLGADGGRKRNTLANLLSKNQTNYQNPGGMQALPSLSPSQTANYYNQLGGLYSQYQLTLAGLRQQRVGLRANAMTQRADIRSQLISGVAGVQQASTERGVLGSSASMQGEAAVRGAAAEQQTAVKTDLLNQLGQLQLSKQQAGLQLYQGTTQLQAGVLAQQQEQLAQQLQNNLIVSGQETQMNAMKAIYEALAGRVGGGSKNAGNSGSAGSIAGNAVQQGIGTVGDYVSGYGAAMTG